MRTEDLRKHFQKHLRKNWLLAGMLSIGVSAMVMLRGFDPATSGVFPPCPVRYLTGWLCPGCGSLRAMHQLLIGNVRAAWGLNPLTVLLLPFLGYGAASYARFEICGRHLRQPFLRPVFIRALCAGIILFGIVRNLPFR